MDFATKLRTLRAARGLTQQGLAELTGIPNTRISDFETGKSLPAGPWLVELKRALNWPEDDSVFEQLATIDGK